ncbi:MAG: hypothetical protein EXR72_15100 [Myxococcales bacterium]|nr:hypothetical protein [Myxococcales bacterium]
MPAMLRYLPFASRFAVAVALVGCNSSTTGLGVLDMAGGSTPDLAMAAQTCAHKVECTDQSVLELNLFRKVSPAKIVSTAKGGGWESAVDATGGGFSPTQSYVYATFTDQGLKKLDITDEDAFASMDWDIAFRRFVIRLNSGISGPSCVTGARTPAATVYDSLATPPANLEYRTEEYFTKSCDYVPDGSGLNSPGTALQSFWEYPGCVKMTGNVFVLKRADGTTVKFTVTGYYESAAQMTCEKTGMVPMGSVGGKVGVRWAFLK